MDERLLARASVWCAFATVLASAGFAMLTAAIRPDAPDWVLWLGVTLVLLAAIAALNSWQLFALGVAPRAPKRRMSLSDVDTYLTRAGTNAKTVFIQDVIDGTLRAWGRVPYKSEVPLDVGEDKPTPPLRPIPVECWEQNPPNWSLEKIGKYEGVVLGRCGLRRRVWLNWIEGKYGFRIRYRNERI